MLHGRAGGPGRYGQWIQRWIMFPTACKTRTSHLFHRRNLTAYASTLSCLYLTETWPPLTGGTGDVAGWTDGTGTSSTYIPTCPRGSFCKIARGTLRSTKWLRDHQMAAESAESCGIPVSMSKTKQNNYPLAKLTWSCLMTTNVMIWVENEAKERGKWWKQ